MKATLRISAAAAIVAALAVSVPSPSFAGQTCKMFSAAGEHLLADWAPLMARQGAINIAEARGYHVVGDAKVVKCGPGGTLGNECYATVKACKRN